jgi:hypothetical protein
MKSSGSNSTCVVPLFHGVLSLQRTLPCAKIDNRLSAIAGRAVPAQAFELVALVGFSGHAQDHTRSVQR